MSVYNLIVKSIKDGNVNLFAELLHNDYVMVSNQNNKEISKDNWIKNVSEMYQSIREGKMSFTENRCLYENDEILLMHQIANFPNNTKQAVLVAHFLKEGKILKTETGATPIN